MLLMSSPLKPKDNPSVKQIWNLHKKPLYGIENVEN